MVFAEGLVVTATIEDSGYQRGVDRLIAGLNKVTQEGKEFGVEMDRISGLVGGLAKTAIGLGGAIATVFTAGLVASPQFKQFIGGLREPWFRFTNFMGQAFQGTLDSISILLKGLVDYVTTDSEFKRVLGFFSDIIGKAVHELTFRLLGDDQTRGLIPAILDITRGIVSPIIPIIFDIDESGLTGLSPAGKAMLAGLLVLKGGALGAGIASLLVAQELQQKYGDPTTAVEEGRITRKDALYPFLYPEKAIREVPEALGEIFGGVNELTGGKFGKFTRPVVFQILRIDDASTPTR